MDIYSCLVLSPQPLVIAHYNIIIFYYAIGKTKSCIVIHSTVNYETTNICKCCSVNDHVDVTNIIMKSNHRIRNVQMVLIVSTSSKKKKTECGNIWSTFKLHLNGLFCCSAECGTPFRKSVCRKKIGKQKEMNAQNRFSAVLCSYSFCHCIWFDSIVFQRLLLSFGAACNGVRSKERRSNWKRLKAHVPFSMLITFSHEFCEWQFSSVVKLYLWFHPEQHREY